MELRERLIDFMSWLDYNGYSTNFGDEVINEYIKSVDDLLALRKQKHLVAKKGELVECMLDCPVMGRKYYGRELKTGDVIRLYGNCYNELTFEKVKRSYSGTIYEPTNE